MVFSKRVYEWSAKAFVLMLFAAFTSSCGAATHRADSLATSRVAAGLVTIDGERFDLEGEAKTHKATVLFWWATTCPCVRRYQDRMADLRKLYPEDEVAIYAIASNADDDVATLKKIAAERGFTIPILVDRSGSLPEEFGIKTTPSTLVLDSAGKAQFTGWIDNERLPGTDGRIPYVENTVNALIGSKPVGESKSPMYGCRITRRIGEEQSCVTPPEQQFAPKAPTCH